MDGKMISMRKFFGELQKNGKLQSARALLRASGHYKSLISADEIDSCDARILLARLVLTNAGLFSHEKLEEIIDKCSRSEDSESLEDIIADMDKWSMAVYDRHGDSATICDFIERLRAYSRREAQTQP